MPVWIQILPGSDQPIYTQIIDQIGEAVAKGVLSPGDKLPAVRKLAGELVINPNTVARAYSLLEQTGLVTTKTGSGTFVSDPNLRDSDAANLNIIAERMDTVIVRGLNLGLTSKDLSRMFNERLTGFINKPKSGKKKK